MRSRSRPHRGANLQENSSPASNNSARPTARRWTGSGVSCAGWRRVSSFAAAEAARLSDRARAAAGKVERTKNMVLYYLMSRDLKSIEGREFTLRAQKNSQDSVRITDEAALPVAFRKIDARIGGVLWETVLANLPDELGKMLESTVEESRPDTDSIKAAILHEEQVPGAELRRGWHLRIK